MIGEVFSMAWYGSYGGGAIGNMLAGWESAGVFSYALPFLLIPGTLYSFSFSK